MGDYRSKSYHVDDRMQMERHYGPGPTTSNPDGFRSYSVSYSSSYAPPPPPGKAGGGSGKDLKLKKAKSTGGSWNLTDPEFQRKKRVASYKVYSVEGKVKGSFRKSFRLIDLEGQQASKWCWFLPECYFLYAASPEIKS
ncbi:hypothetical protein RJ639_047137 [Escallonia herrerae]|uniref:Uncharacterized protein n=1 Tax=Escallonia herrerae TaxID=1293975 RepID=A0AA88W5P5_9ASTE|nr:hypothetical protein RJ639_047137 [Escallonia herrerae]